MAGLEGIGKRLSNSYPIFIVVLLRSRDGRPGIYAPDHALEILMLGPGNERALHLLELIHGSETAWVAGLTFKAMALLFSKLKYSIISGTMKHLPGVTV